MELIAKISKGTKMDQVYLPKNRNGFPAGSYVILNPVSVEKQIEKPYFYGIENLEPIKIELAEQIFSLVSSITENDNIIITGSFIEKGFNFNDIDIIVIAEKLPVKEIEKSIKEKTKIEVHVINFTKDFFIKALKLDPIYRLMLNKCLSKKRLQPLPEIKHDYKYLDLQLLKSELLIINFDYLNGKEKYKYVRNAIAIYLFFKNKFLSNDNVESEIKKQLNVGTNEIKNNLVNKEFLKKYKKFHNKLKMDVINSVSKQK